MRLQLVALASAVLVAGGSAVGAEAPLRHRLAELKATATTHVGKTADWVALSRDAVWVGSTGPDAVTHLDPGTGRAIITVAMPGEPCAGLAVGFKALWVPLCAPTPRLARVSLASSRVIDLYAVGPPRGEGGVTVSRDSVWLVTDANGTLARIDPMTGALRGTVALPPGSFNPLFQDGVVWVTQSGGATVTLVDAAGATVLGTRATGPGPRFLAAGEGALFTLNQGDGTLTRIDLATQAVTHTTRLGTPGHGGDLTVAAGLVWITMAKVPLAAVDATSGELLCQWTGRGGDSLAVGFDAIWLTDYHRGNIARIPLAAALAQCGRKPP